MKVFGSTFMPNQYRNLEKKNKKGRYRLIGRLPFIKCKKTIEIYRHFFVGYKHRF
jgi:hypothetical protein